jgi:hypothetical protein
MDDIIDINLVIDMLRDNVTYIFAQAAKGFEAKFHTLEVVMNKPRQYLHTEEKLLLVVGAGDAKGVIGVVEAGVGSGSSFGSGAGFGSGFGFGSSSGFGSGCGYGSGSLDGVAY